MPKAPNNEIPYNVPWSAQQSPPSPLSASGAHRAGKVARPQSPDALLQQALEILENPSRPQGWLSDLASRARGGYPLDRSARRRTIILACSTIALIFFAVIAFAIYQSYDPWDVHSQVVRSILPVEKYEEYVALPSMRKMYYKKIGPAIPSIKVVGKHVWVVALYGVCGLPDVIKEYGHDPPVTWILHSPDGGRKWEIQKVIPNWCLSQLRFITKTEGYAIGPTGIIHTSNGGKYWNFLNLPPETRGIQAALIDPKNHYHIVIYNQNGIKYETFDGGRNWKKVVSSH